MRRALADVPLARYEDGAGSSFAGYISAFLRHQHELHTFMDEISRGLPVSKLLGLPFDPTQHWLIVRDPTCVRHFLKDRFDLYTKPGPDHAPIFYYFKKWLGDGIFIVDHGVGARDGGEAWRRQRKLMATIFTRSNFQHKFQETFASKARRLCGVLAEAARSGGRVDLQRLFFCFTMDSAMDILCGESTDTLGGEACVYGDAFDRTHRAMISYARPSTKMLKLLQTLPFPLGGAGGLAWRLHAAMNSDYRRFDAARRVLQAESGRIVAACRSDPLLGKRRDILALLVQNEEKERFSPVFLRDAVSNLMIAGRDTTACLLSWAFYMLATNPEVQAKLCAEIDERLPGLAEPDVRSLAPGVMPYLNGVIWEALRLHPPVPADMKVSMQDDVMPDGTHVPAGTVAVFLPMATGRDPAVYDEPLAVRPERWIPFTAPPPHEFPAFQAGPRICLGQDMAIFEAKICTAMLLQRFSFTMPPGEAEKIHYSNTLTMSVCNSKKQDSHNLWMEPRLRA